MSVILIEGFDTHLNVATMISAGWSQVQFSSLAVGRSGAGRGQCLVCTAVGASVLTYLTLCSSRPLGANLTSGIVGVALSHSGTTTGDVILHFFNSATQTALFYVYFNAVLGRVEIWMGNAPSATMINASNNGIYIPTAWNYFEIKFVSGTSGSIEVRLNTLSSIINKSNVNISANSGIVDTIIFDQPPSQTQNFSIDDIYVLNLLGSTNNTFLGDSVVCTCNPAGAGSVTQFTPHSSTNWSQVKETQLDGDTTYNSAATVGTTDMFTITPMWFQTAAPIYALSINVANRADEQSTANLATVLSSGSSTTTGSNIVPNPIYLTPCTIYEQDPDISASWTRTKVNSIQVGYKIV